ncbi:MAG: cysteine-rich repeat protein [Bradymonadia bacterium]
MVVTWRTVEAWNRDSSNGLNTFQVVLTERSDRADGDFDVEFRYEDINWTFGSASSGTHAQIGFDAGDSVNFVSHPLSQTPGVVDIGLEPSNWDSDCATGSFKYFVVNSCGNTGTDADEACDDGNPTAGDGCGPFCDLEPGFTCPTPGVPFVEICCDSLVVGAEECDDRGTATGDGCDDVCAVEHGFDCSSGTCLEICGDSLVVGAEQCDDGNVTPGDGCSDTCTLESACGDGVIEGLETCDDSNATDGDGCSSAYDIEPGFDCSTGICVSVCGDGLVVGTEDCDDSGESDFCDVDCTIAECGDATLNISSGESCEDGNITDGDGCDSVCEIEGGDPCPIAATNALGLGTVFGDTCEAGDTDDSASCAPEGSAGDFPIALTADIDGTYIFDTANPATDFDTVL